MAIKTFTTGEVLTAADTNTYLANSGLVYIATGTGSSSASIPVNGCFSSTFDNYVVVASLTNSVNSQIRIKLRNGTTNKSANYYWGGFYFDMVGGGALNGEGSGGAVSTGVRVIAYNTNGVSNIVTQIGTPFTTTRTTFATQVQSTETYFRIFNGLQDEAYSATGIDVIPDSGTISGTVVVYGYRKA